MKKKTLIVLSFLVIFIINLFSEIPSLSIIFNDDDNSYSATFYFTSSLDKELLLKIYYDINHFKHIYRQFNTIKILQESDNWYRVSFINKTGFYVLNTVYKKIFYKEENKITFVMEKYDQNRDILPELISSTGYYAVEKADAKNKVIYHQDTKLLRSCNPVQKILIRKNLEKFAVTMADYISQVKSQQKK